MAEVGDNSASSFPSGLRDASVVAWNRYMHMLVERRQIAARVRDVVQDAKKHGYAPPALRTAHRLSRMTPEKREKWAKEIALAAAAFGFEGLQFADDDKRDEKLSAFLKRMHAEDADRKNLTKRLKELQENAVAAGVDFVTLKQVAASPACRLEPGAEREEWHAKQTRFSEILGWW